MKIEEEYKLFQEALDIDSPWYIIDHELSAPKKRLDIYITFKRGSKFRCPNCGNANNEIHDIVNDDRRWRHINFFEYHTYIHAKHPRIKCRRCQKIRSIEVEWARKSCSFTWKFEADVMELMKEMPVVAVARRVGEHDTRLWRIFHYYVNRTMKQMDFQLRQA